MGAAIGYAVGSTLGVHLGWRYAFLICGLPGVALAALTLKINDPGMGYYDENRHRDEIPLKQTILMLLKNKIYM